MLTLTSVFKMLRLLNLVIVGSCYCFPINRSVTSLFQSQTAHKINTQTHRDKYINKKTTNGYKNKKFSIQTAQTLL